MIGMDNKYSVETKRKKIDILQTDRQITLTFSNKVFKDRTLQKYSTSITSYALADIMAYLLRTNKDFKRRVFGNFGMYAQSSHLKDLFSPTIEQNDKEVIVIQD